MTFFKKDLSNQDINAQNKCGNTRLHIAAWNNQLHEIKILLASPEIDVNILNSFGCTALGYAVKKANYEIVKFLLEKGANPDLFGYQYGISPALHAHHLAKTKKNLTSIVIAALFENKFYDMHPKILNLWIALGYATLDEISRVKEKTLGICHGYSTIGAIVCQKGPTFFNEVNGLLDKYSTISLTKKIQSAKNKLLNAQTSGKEDRLLLALDSFIENASIAHNLEKYDYLLEDSFRNRAQSSPTEMYFMNPYNMDGNALVPSKNGLITGVHDVVSLKNIFRLFQDEIDRNTFINPITFMISAEEHASFVIYFPHEKRWLQFNINFGPAIYIRDLNQLAHTIVASHSTDTKDILVNIQLFSSLQDVKTLQFCINSLNNHPEWLTVNHIAPEHNYEIFMEASLIGNINTVLEAANVEYPPFVFYQNWKQLTAACGILYGAWDLGFYTEMGWLALCFYTIGIYLISNSLGMGQNNVDNNVKNYIIEETEKENNIRNEICDRYAELECTIGLT